MILFLPIISVTLEQNEKVKSWSLEGLAIPPATYEHHPGPGTLLGSQNKEILKMSSLLLV